MSTELIPVHEEDLVSYCVATIESMRAAMTRAYEYAKTRCYAPEDVELVDQETGELKTHHLRIVIGPDLDPMTVKQRRFLHGVVFKQIAERAVINGEQYDLKTWKEYYRKRFLGANGIRWVKYKAPGEKRARPHAERVSTEELSVKQYSEHIDRVIADATTELGVEFDIDPQEREAVRWKRKPRKAKETTNESEPRNPAALDRVQQPASHGVAGYLSAPRDAASRARSRAPEDQGREREAVSRADRGAEPSERAAHGEREAE